MKGFFMETISHSFWKLFVIEYTHLKFFDLVTFGIRGVFIADRRYYQCFIQMMLERLKNHINNEL